jgi:hypothetical protein
MDAHSLVLQAAGGVKGNTGEDPCYEVRCILSGKPPHMALDVLWCVGGGWKCRTRWEGDSLGRKSLLTCDRRPQQTPSAKFSTHQCYSNVRPFFSNTIDTECSGIEISLCKMLIANVQMLLCCNCALISILTNSSEASATNRQSPDVTTNKD